MIPKEEIENAAREFAESEYVNNNAKATARKAFKAGIEFSREKEEENSILFTDWVTSHCVKILGGWIFNYENIANKPRTLESLLKTFKEQQ